MSVEAITWAFKQSPASAADKFVLVALANFAGETHQCFPSRKKLAEMAMVSVDTIDRAIARLCEGGFIVKDERLHTKGGRASNCYTLQIEEPSRNVRLPAETTLAATRGHPQPQPAPTLAAPACGQGSRNAAATKEPLKEPSNEPDVGDGANAKLKFLPDGYLDRLTECAARVLADPVNAIGLTDPSVPLMWLREGCDFDLDVIPAVTKVSKSKRVSNVHNWNYFSQAVSNAKAARLQGLPPATADRPAPTSERNAIARSLRESIRLGEFNVQSAS